LTEHGEGAQTSADASTLRQDEAGVDPHPVRRYQTQLFSENKSNQAMLKKIYQTKLFSGYKSNQAILK
jgi:hypothetical protein